MILQSSINEILTGLHEYVNSVLADARPERSADETGSYNVRYCVIDYSQYGDSADVRYSLRDNGPAAALSAVNARLEPGFVACLLEEIDRKGLLDTEVYKAAGIDRRLFSKIKSDPSYKPSKDTCVALAMALKLNTEEADRLLSKAGFTFSHSIKRDIILEYFFKCGIYDLDLANSLLDSMGEKTLGR